MLYSVHGSYLKDLILQYVALTAYVFFVYITFCDGFSLKPLRKFIWAAYFVGLSVISYLAVGRFDLRVIISLSSMLAIILIWIQKKENK